MAETFFDRINKNKTQHTPDVLSCLANLSNDEVFTPPEVANQMLNLLPQELFSDPNATFLDPACKTGVFLREIAKRLIVGLADKIPDLRQRIDHIFHKQLYGIAITELTSLLSRRSLYCSKYPNGEYSVSHFDNAEGNVRFRRINHVFVNGKCKFCGANKTYDRGEEKETHAYEFIHTTSPEKIFNMKFDVIISNPPYQLSDAGAFASASPIYQNFVSAAKKLHPRFISMVIPARWFAGGKGLDAFRKEMLNDDQLREIHDFSIGEDCFPGVRISGGICYFLWARSTHGECSVYTHSGNTITSQMTRPLLEKNADTFIRINEAIPILRKVQVFNEPSFASLVSPLRPFGLRTDFFNDTKKYNLPPISDTIIPNGIKIVGTYKYKTTFRYVNRNYPVPLYKDYIDKYKVFVSNVLDNGFDWHKERLSPFIGKPYEICTETFLVVGKYDDEKVAKNVITYMNTKFFHLLMFLKKVSHHVVSKVYEFVPMQDFSKPWTDEELYKKYNLSQEEIDFIESMIKTME